MAEPGSENLSARFLRLPSIAERKLGRDYAAPVRLDPRVLDQMQQTIRELGVQYAETLKAQVGSLFAFIDTACRGQHEPRGQLYDLAHEVRGIAGTFGFPVVGRFAHSLCGYLETRRAIDPTVLRFHVEAMYDALQNMQTDPSVADATLKSLERLIESTNGDERSFG